MTLAAIRHKYYLPKNYSTVQHILHKFCFHCRKRRAKPLKQPTIATIPDYRLVEGDQPFFHIGIDILITRIFFTLVEGTFLTLQ